MKLKDLLLPPAECQAKGMPLTDKRKGFMWFCTLARKNFARGRKKPGCYCATVLQGTRKALEEAGDE